MMPWLLHMKDKEIVIIGGGKVAYNKAMQWLSEGAKITIIAKEVLPVFNQIDCSIILSTYHKSLLNNTYFIVYAATDNTALNREIVTDGNSLGILTASATKADTVLRKMTMLETEELTIGISTKHNYPAITKKIREELETYDAMLSVLCPLRTYIIEKDIVVKEERKTFFETLLQLSIRELQQLFMTMQSGSYKVLIFQGKESEEALAFATNTQALAVFRKSNTYPIFQYLFTTMKIPWILYPIVLSQGIIYDTICHEFSSFKVRNPIFSDNTLLEKRYSENKKRMFIIHPRTNTKLLQILSKYGDVMTFKESQDLSHYQEVIPFILTAGYHYKTDFKQYTDYVTHPVILKDSLLIPLLIEKIKKDI